uniref:protein-tyrosine-phosphatase n=1 Tax=Crassostrea virginica TaxID=6565 RepID=A0A8B8C4X8_CRAVI|nr:receptor-type tyrosine-protein phosphatase epsilon-like isoform X2 [Crassostrea virginica]
MRMQAVENLALRKNVWEDHPWPNTFTWRARNAVDGRYTDRSAAGAQCVITENFHNESTWGVDLGDVVSISHIDIYYRTDNMPKPSAYTARMAGFFLYVSNTTSKEDGHLCFHEIQTVNGTPSEDQKINCSVHGRYVIYYNERSPNVTYPSYYSTYAYYELCEVEVYGCRNVGYYGQSCNISCPTNCQEKRCDVNAGHCLGCVPGYQGPTCDQECANDKFGSSCEQSCGNCITGDHCHHVNGSCLKGCSPGYIGIVCQQHCDETFYGPNCASNCSNDCVNNTCDYVSGECFAYKQPLNHESPVVSENIPVISGLIAAFVIVVLAIVLFVIFKRRTGTETTPKKDGRRTSANNENSTGQNFPNIYQNIGMETDECSENVQSSSSSNNQERTLKDDDVDIDEKNHEENPYGDLYINDKRLPDIEVKNLYKTIQEHSANEDDGFKKEYAAILYGERHPCEVGKRPENLQKNRFKTTFPYDHSRVVLCNIKQDYINANYIDGLNDSRKYIASQGPKQNTLSDFWHMIWQENISQIVMLTNLREGIKNKCAQYWPEGDKTITFGTLTLHLEEEKTYAHYIIRRIKMSHKKLIVIRTVTQYHYTAWPDHGTPDSICLLMYHSHVTRTKDLEHNGPILVHCSAGLGRTGTYIAIDTLGDTLREIGAKINIAEFVKKMRKDRMNMVQTYEQYKTIFLVLNEMCKVSFKSKSPTYFVRSLETGDQDKPVNSSALRKEFQMLLSVRPHYMESDYKISAQSGDVSPIRPLDKHVLYLTTSVPRRGSYINAISLSSYTSPSVFIITKYPAPGDAVDLLRLIIDHESEVVVCLDPLSHNKSASTWLPNWESLKSVPPFSTRLREEHFEEVKCSKINIDKEGSVKKEILVDIVEPTSDLITNHSDTVLQILKLVTVVGNIETESPIIVISKDGAALCGVFCTVYNAIQQLTMDNEVDVFSIVRQLQIRRMELCSNLQEYKLIHDVLKTFIELRQSQTVENIYSNQ